MVTLNLIKLAIKINHTDVETGTWTEIYEGVFALFLRRFSKLDAILKQTGYFCPPHPVPLFSLRTYVSSVLVSISAHYEWTLVSSLFYLVFQNLRKARHGGAHHYSSTQGTEAGSRPAWSTWQVLMLVFSPVRLQKMWRIMWGKMKYMYTHVYARTLTWFSGLSLIHLPFIYHLFIIIYLHIEMKLSVHSCSARAPPCRQSSSHLSVFIQPPGFGAGAPS